ncbi:hypothetical protein CI238_01149 [Colletotrichum incanum]|uniref:Uncharacterized protein n=1 Tax=Colletotrichum incanum TaxID=1573173 RepID=A0A161VZP8_COLIC|nr:hypothetical protein CI238_01149 [Colletotrichum incanum]
MIQKTNRLRTCSEPQDVACAKCSKVICLKCLNSPVNHVLGEQTSVVFLKDNGKAAQLDREDIEKIDAAGYQVAAQLDSAVSRIESEVKKLNATMSGLQKDIDRHKADLSSARREGLKRGDGIQSGSKIFRLENQVQAASAAVSEIQKLSNDARSEMDELRPELQATRNEFRRLENTLSDLQQELAYAKKASQGSLDTLESTSKEMTSLRADLAQLRRAMEQDRSKRLVSANPQLNLTELDILSSNITKIGTRASQIESLQKEFDLFKRGSIIGIKITDLSSTRNRFSKPSIEAMTGGQDQGQPINILSNTTAPPSPTIAPRSRKRNVNERHPQNVYQRLLGMFKPPNSLGQLQAPSTAGMSRNQSPPGVATTMVNSSTNGNAEDPGWQDASPLY